MKKMLTPLMMIPVLTLSIACNDRFDEGYAEGRTYGYNEGYNEGKTEGDAQGYERARVYFSTAGYQEGFDAGKIIGDGIGYTRGFDEGRASGYRDGQASGYQQGLEDGFWAGDQNGFERGWESGVEYGFVWGYGEGYIDGENGFPHNPVPNTFGASSDGWVGLSIGKTRKLKGYSNLLSMVHNDVFDYSLIPVPQVTKRGLVVGGKLIFSETSLTNKDTLKRAAAVEQYLVTEMAKQVQFKFGLSAERSLKVAKASNHFRKYSSARALTADDTLAYAEEIIGVDFKTVENAYTQSLKGNISALNSVMEKAAAKNGVSPEKMNGIVMKMFF